MHYKIIPGIVSSIGDVQGHKPIYDITRHLLLDNFSVRGKSFHIATHIISRDYVHSSDWKFCEYHSHAFDELNLILSENDNLEYRYEIEGTAEIVKSPSSVFIPAGKLHRMEPTKGRGIFVCIQLNSQPPY